MSALTPYLSSRNRTSILTTLYSDEPFNRMEFKDADSFDVLELSQQILVFVFAEVSLYPIVVGIKCLKSFSSSSWTFCGKSLSFLINSRSCNFFISSFTYSKASGSFCNLRIICLFCSFAVALFPFTELLLNALICRGLVMAWYELNHLLHHHLFPEIIV